MGGIHPLLRTWWSPCEPVWACCGPVEFRRWWPVFAVTTVVQLEADVHAARDASNEQTLRAAARGQVEAARSWWSGEAGERVFLPGGSKRGSPEGLSTTLRAVSLQPSKG
jgi:hypothetical protein